MDTSKEITQLLLDHWDDVTRSWDAQAKEKYYRLIFSDMVNCSERVYLNNLNLEQYSENCINAVK